MGKSSRKQSTHTGGSKYFRRVILGKLQVTWDMAGRYFPIEVPVGIADANLKFRGVNGIHLHRFGAFSCSHYKVGWGDVDDPIDCEDYLIEREFWRLKRRCLAPIEHPFSHMWGYTDFNKQAQPSHSVGWRVLLYPRSISPSKGLVCLPFYAAFNKAWIPHMHFERCVSRWSVSPTHGSPPPPSYPSQQGLPPAPVRHHTHYLSFFRITIG